jgi:hypothetical protein
MTDKQMQRRLDFLNESIDRLELDLTGQRKERLGLKVQLTQARRGVRAVRKREHEERVRKTLAWKARQAEYGATE